MNGPSRRDVLSIAGGTVLASSLAGCTDLEAMPFVGPSEPEYLGWVPADDGGEDRSTYVYLDTSERVFDEDEVRASGGGPIHVARDDFAGLFLLFAGFGTVSLTLVSGVGVARYPFLAPLFSDEIDHEEVDDADEAAEDDGTDEDDPDDGAGDDSAVDDPVWETDVEGILFPGEAIVLLGSIDVDEVEDVATPVYETVAERDGYTLFARRGEETPLFAADRDAIVLPIGDDRNATLERLLDARSGDHDRFTDQAEDLDWAAETAGIGRTVYGGVELETEDLEDGPFDDVDVDLGEIVDWATPWDFHEDARGLVSSLKDHDESLVGELALVYDDEETTPTEEEIVEQVTPTTADEYAVEVDGTRVELDATWRLDENGQEDVDAAAGDDAVE